MASGNAPLTSAFSATIGTWAAPAKFAPSQQLAMVLGRAGSSLLTIWSRNSSSGAGSGPSPSAPIPKSTDTGRPKSTSLAMPQTTTEAWL